MTTKIDDGGYAFASSSSFDSQHGMTLREWYAGMAMQGMISRGTIMPIKEYVSDLFTLADAMIAESKKGRGE